jgi:hypothetical protein
MVVSTRDTISCKMLLGLWGNGLEITESSNSFGVVEGITFHFECAIICHICQGVHELLTKGGHSITFEPNKVVKVG